MNNSNPGSSSDIHSEYDIDNDRELHSHNNERPSLDLGPNTAETLIESANSASPESNLQQARESGYEEAVDHTTLFISPADKVSLEEPSLHETQQQQQKPVDQKQPEQTQSDQQPIEVLEFDEELDQQTERLVRAAVIAQQRAYAPYSNYFVGAAIRTQSGSIYAGCNFENASYGLAICAEQCAVGSMITGGHRKISAVAICSQGAVPPCGACRQVLAEFGEDFPIYLVDSLTNAVTARWKLSQLLPVAFTFER